MRLRNGSRPIHPQDARCSSTARTVGADAVSAPSAISRRRLSRRNARDGTDRALPRLERPAAPSPLDGVHGGEVRLVRTRLLPNGDALSPCRNDAGSQHRTRYAATEQLLCASLQPAARTSGPPGRRALHHSPDRDGRACSRSLPLNPVRSELCRLPEDWPWSSFAATIGLRREPAFLDSSWMLRLFSDDLSTARRMLRDFVHAALVSETLEVA